MSISLQPHELRHIRLPCPSLSPRVCSDSCPLSRWCHPTITASAAPFSSRRQSFPASGSFPMSRFFASNGLSIGVSASAEFHGLLLGRKAVTNLDSILKSRDIILLTKVHSVKVMVFPTVVYSSHVWMWDLDYKESRMPKNWCFWTVVLEKTLDSPLDCKEIQPVHPKGN